jgi:hypothetical protein
MLLEAQVLQYHHHPLTTKICTETMKFQDTSNKSLQITYLSTTLEKSQHPLITHTHALYAPVLFRGSS